MELNRKNRALPCRSGFSLVEVTVALAIAAFAMVSLIGLLSVGLDHSRRSMDRSVEGQIVDWSRGRAKVAYEAKSLKSVETGNPYYFDGEGIAVSATDAEAGGRRIFSATITPIQRGLPGSQQSIWGVQVRIEAPARGNQLVATHAFWFRK